MLHKTLLQIDLRTLNPRQIIAIICRNADGRVQVEHHPLIDWSMMMASAASATAVATVAVSTTAMTTTMVVAAAAVTSANINNNNNNFSRYHERLRRRIFFLPVLKPRSMVGNLGQPPPIPFLILA